MDREKDKWKTHLFGKTKEELLRQCTQLKIPVQTSVAKMPLVKLICNKNGEPEQPTPKPEFTGSFSSVPSTASAINCLTVGKLRQILRYYNMPVFGTKDELSLRVYLLRHGCFDAV